MYYYSVVWKISNWIWSPMYTYENWNHFIAYIIAILNQIIRFAFTDSFLLTLSRGHCGLRSQTVSVNVCSAYGMFRVLWPFFWPTKHTAQWAMCEHRCHYDTQLNCCLLTYLANDVASSWMLLYPSQWSWY